MNRLNEWTDEDDDAPTQKFVHTARGIAVVRSSPPQRDGLWDANDVARYLKVRGGPRASHKSKVQ